MGTRIPASMRTREALSALIEGRLASPAGRSELVELATRLIVEEALEGEVRDALDRGYYERGDAPGLLTQTAAQRGCRGEGLSKVRLTKRIRCQPMPEHLKR